MSDECADAKSDEKSLLELSSEQQTERPLPLHVAVLHLVEELREQNRIQRELMITVVEQNNRLIEILADGDGNDGSEPLTDLSGAPIRQ